MREYLNTWTSRGVSEWLGYYVKVWIIECVSEFLSEGMSGRVSQWVSDSFSARRRRVAESDILREKLGEWWNAWTFCRRHIRMDFFSDIFHNLALLEFYFLNIIYILLYIDFILSIFFQHSNILTRASHHWCLASNIVLVVYWCMWSIIQLMCIGSFPVTIYGMWYVIIHTAGP